jgi:hypothetical protein
MPGSSLPPQARLLFEIAGQPFDLQTWLPWVTGEIQRHAAVLEERDRRLDERDRQLAAVSQEVSALRSELQQVRALAKTKAEGPVGLRDQMADMDRRLNKILALVNDKLGGGQTEEAMMHHTYAKEYVSFVEQKIGLLTVNFFRAFAVSPQEKAQFVATLCEYLFAHQDVHEDELVGALQRDVDDLQLRRALVQQARDLCAQARALRGKAAVGRRQRWEFSFTPGDALNAEWQEPWRGSDHEGVAAFVVAPAYMVDDRTPLAKQWVFIVGQQENDHVVHGDDSAGEDASGQSAANIVGQ